MRALHAGKVLLTQEQVVEAMALVVLVVTTLEECGIPQHFYTLGQPTIKDTTMGIEVGVEVQWLASLYGKYGEEFEKALHHIHPGTYFHESGGRCMVFTCLAGTWSDDPS